MYLTGTNSLLIIPHILGKLNFFTLGPTSVKKSLMWTLSLNNFGDPRLNRILAHTWFSSSVITLLPLIVTKSVINPKCSPLSKKVSMYHRVGKSHNFFQKNQKIRFILFKSDFFDTTTIINIIIIIIIINNIIIIIIFFNPR